MSEIIRATTVTFVILALIAAGASATAAKPAFTGMKCPPAVDGMTGAVTGRVTASMNASGVGNAYVAIVNASNVSEEYFNTTSDAYGYYQFVGVNASYNATNGSDVGPNGATPYKIYSSTWYGEGYSASFGVDASGGPTSPGAGISPVLVTATPTPTPSPTPSPSITLTPTPEPATAATTTPTPSPTATPRPTPGLVPALLPLLLAALIAIVTTRRKKN